MNILEEIKKEHDQYRDLLEELADTDRRHTNERKEKFEELRREVKAHHEAEEHTLFERLQKEEEAKFEVLESIEEHHVLEDLLKKIEDTAEDDETWGPKLQVLKEILEHHMDEEEDEVFEKSKDLLSDDELESLREDFESKKSEEKDKM
ncbi:hemerythrin domain-containing protein [Clostridium sp. D2Q-11]|uniref:Hemerythrin domain-containing protein n=1 Tax=Anaeromonas frigoriresistens TaxID=2683708 RepID=A0A942V269_9FIRM|nr:hemerythrin domain-containing protein [Anaeromonas frigoriresistens]MBS4538622.1 hemerythrin domain-containing protein [Anaeromonas frigoriresistens]